MIFNFSILSIFIFISSCSTSSLNIEKDQNERQETNNVASIEVKILNEDIRPGEVSFLQFKTKLEKDASLMCKGKKIKYHYTGEYFKAMVPESYFSDLKDFSCHYGKEKVAHFKVNKREFPSERLHVDKKRVFLSKKNLKRVRKEQVFLNKNYRSSPDQPYFNESFDLPINSHITSIYGTKRVFNKKKQTQHLGTDFRAAVGTPIATSNSGKVVVSRELFFTGHTVTIDHGLGVFTVYGHLSKRFVKEGDIVEKGMILGHAGKTGRVTGPHLHWGVKVNGEWVDGISLVDETSRKSNGE